jgi:SAM-dependent methyltransferase
MYTSSTHQLGSGQMRKGSSTTARGGDNLRPLRRRESFDSVAEFYDEYRTSPPNEVVDDVIASARLARDSKVLEIGCGTGQLSVSLAEYGVELTAVELGPHLADRARQNLRQFSNARVETSSFEDWPLPPEKFDAVVVANAFHWIDPHTRFSKVAEALSPSGFLVILHVHHVRGGTKDFCKETQPFYVKWGLSDDPAFQPTTPQEAPVMYPELDHNPGFKSVERHRFEIPMTYSTRSYIGWLNTDSLVNGLEKESRSRFLGDIEKLIESKHNGEIIRNYVYEVVVAQRDA